MLPIPRLILEPSGINKGYRKQHREIITSPVTTFIKRAKKEVENRKLNQKEEKIKNDC